MLSARVEIGPIIPIKCTLNAFIALAHINVILFSLGFCCGKDSISRVYRIGLRKTIHWEMYPLHEFHDTFDPCPLFRVRRWLNQQNCVTSFWDREWEVKAIPGTRHTIYWLTLTRLNKTNCQFDFSKFQHRNQILKIIWTEDQLRGIEGNSSEIRASCWHERRRSGLRSVFCFLSMAAATSGIDFRTCLPYNFKYDILSHIRNHSI